MFVLLGSQVSDQAAGIITWYRTHQHWSAGLHLRVQKTNVSKRFNNTGASGKKMIEVILVTTSLSTILARSRGCSMMFMKVSPSTFETKMCDMASRRSGRKASISSSWCTAWPMAAEQGAVYRKEQTGQSRTCHVYTEYIHIYMNFKINQYLKQHLLGQISKVYTLTGLLLL